MQPSYGQQYAYPDHLAIGGAHVGESLSESSSKERTASEEPKAGKGSNPKPKRSGTVLQRLMAILVEQLGVEEEDVNPSSNFVDDLNADSLDLVELILSLEEEFDSTIPDEDANEIKDVQTALDYLAAHGVVD